MPYDEVPFPVSCAILRGLFRVSGHGTGYFGSAHLFAESDYEKAIYEKAVKLEQQNGESARKDFVVNVLAPYLDALSRNEIYKSGPDNESFERIVSNLYGKFFPDDGAAQSLFSFMNAAKVYFSGESFNVDLKNTVNRNLLKYGLFLDFELQSMASILKVQDTLLPMTAYKGDSLTT